MLHRGGGALSSMNRYQKLEKLIGIKFKNRKLLNTVFIHKSYLNEYKGSNLEPNERLEFLGDAVLELVITEFLYQNYPNPEGELTAWRSALVKGAHLANIARKLNLGDCLYLSQGEERSFGREKNFILANTFEALLGAIYLEKGYAAAHRFISKFVLVHLEEILEKGLYLDSKSHLQEIAQAKFNITPTYRVFKEEGPDHKRIFTVSVYLKEKPIGEGKGRSKQEAEQKAARDALEKKKWK